MISFTLCIIDQIKKLMELGETQNYTQRLNHHFKKFSKLGIKSVLFTLFASVEFFLSKSSIFFLKALILFQPGSYFNNLFKEIPLWLTQGNLLPVILASKARFWKIFANKRLELFEDSATRW